MNAKHDHDSHSHSHGAHLQGKAPKVIVRAILVTVVFMLIEALGGWYSNSLALASDAVHMLTDIGAMLLSLFAIWIARRPSTPSMSFGYHRAEILGALVSGFLIWVISGVLIYEAIQRMQSPPAVKGSVVFVVATIGLIANLVTMGFLVSAKDENINVKAAYLHILSDSLGNLGTIIAGVVLWWTDWRPIDPIITIVFCALMVISTWSLIKEAIHVLMESTPTNVNPDKVKKELLAIPGVQEAHDLHIWAVSTGKLALSVHLVSTQAEMVLNLANQMLEREFHILHTTIQIEHPDHFQSSRCYDCLPIELKTIQ